MASWWPAARASIVGVALVILFTNPTIPRLTTVGRLDTGDGRFSIWNVGWIGHVLLTSPTDLWNANIFWPHQGALAYSEPNLVAGVLGLPWFVATRSSLAALNGAAATALLLAFVLMAALVRRLFASETAALFAATAFTFCPYVSARTAHIQLLMVFVLPLTAIAFHRLAERPDPARGVGLGLALFVSVLSCSYYGLFAGCMTAVLVLAWGTRSVQYWTSIGIALVTLVVLLVPLYLVFAHLRGLSGAPSIGRSPSDALGYAANVSAYLASSALAHAWWLPALARWQRWSDVLFPGVVVLIAAIVGAVVSRRNVPGRRIILVYLTLALLACWASFGPAAGLYRVLQMVPGVSYLRVPSRFGIVVTFSLVIAAAAAAADLNRRWRPAALALMVLVACESGVSTSAWGWPSWPLMNAPAIPTAYRVLATLPRGPLVEFPFAYDRAAYHGHTYPMFFSTYHWQPLVNGYSDLIPPDFDQIVLPINGFPDPESFAIMRARGVRYVLWHTTDYTGETRRIVEERLARYPSNLRPIVRDEQAWLYEIQTWPSDVPFAGTAAPGVTR